MGYDESAAILIDDLHGSCYRTGWRMTSAASRVESVELSALAVE
jgi:hypothetical protein